MLLPPPPNTYIVLSRDIMNNKVFYQHPNLMRALGMHETVMEVMVNVLGGGESKVKENLLLLKCQRIGLLEEYMYCSFLMRIS